MEKHTQKKSLNQLRKGDIIFMRIPFEENTPDYYNGYSPQEIRGSLYVDKEGQTGKSRYVIVIGHEYNSITYLPMTSRHARFDNLHQYELQDNSMTYRKDPKMKSYVEVNSLRCVYANPKWGITYQGRITENDMINIMVKLSHRKLNFESDRDQRVYISQNKNKMFDRQIKENGYSLSKETALEKVYEKEDGRTITKADWGLAKYHVPLSKEAVTELIAKHEGRPVDDFSQAVAAITNNESEVVR